MCVFFFSFASFWKKAENLNGKWQNCSYTPWQTVAVTAATETGEWALHQCTAHAQNTWINNQAKSPCSANDPFDVIASVPVNKDWNTTTVCGSVILLSISICMYAPFYEPFHMKASIKSIFDIKKISVNMMIRVRVYVKMQSGRSGGEIHGTKKRERE